MSKEEGEVEGGRGLVQCWNVVLRVRALLLGCAIGTHHKCEGSVVQSVGSVLCLEWDGEVGRCVADHSTCAAACTAHQRELPPLSVVGG